jgi:hypothetical protein
MTRRLVGRLFIGVLLLIGSSSAFAQSGSGIAGVVKDATGAVLPGVSVEAASPVLIEKVRTVVTDAAGQYKIVDLRPGTYSVTFSLAGFSTVKRDGIELTASFTASVNADMRVGAVEETVTVSGAAPTVDVQNVVQQKVMTRDVIDAIPSGQKGVASVGALIPGVVTLNQDVGGTASTVNQMAIHGGRQGEMQLLYDGLYYNNGQGRGGQFTALALNDGTVQELSLETGGLSAESELGGIRTNVVPKEGGNTFKGTGFGAVTGSKLQSDNFSDTLKAQGLTSVPRTNKVYDVNAGLGGPLALNKLWFYGSFRRWASYQEVAGIYYSADPTAHVYTPDLSRPAQSIETNTNMSLRLTWQATPRNKINVQAQQAPQDRPFYGYSLGALTTAPEATQASKSIPDYFGLASWTSPVTSRLLLEAGAGFVNKDYVVFPQPGVDLSTPSYKDLGTNITWGNYGGGSSTLFGHNDSHQFNTRFTASYVTGSHAVKAGFTFMNSSSYVTSSLNPTQTTLQLLNGVPRQVTVFAIPLTLEEVMKANVGLFGQDQWTIRRFTLNAGLRFDYLNSYVPAQHIGPAPQVPNRNVDFPEVDDVPNWKNVSPRLGAVYDLFGDGKTAVKVNLGRYLEGPNLVSFTRAANPAGAIVQSATRTWTDLNGDFVPQADELGPLSNANFGNSVITTTYAPDALTTRGYNWEFSGAVQHELLPKLSVNVSYFRRWYGNLRVTQNTAVTTANFSPYCITGPVDSRLPGGGGDSICGFNDVNAAQFGKVINVIQNASHFGNPEDVYDGVDVNLNARLPRAVVVSGGVSIGRERTNNCYAISDLSLTNALPAAAPKTNAFCDVRPPLQPNVKFLAVYPLPWNVQAAATFQSLPGPQITATYAATNAQIAPSLGRNLSSGASGTATVDLIPPGTMYSDRIYQLDFRVSKTLVPAHTHRLQANLDVYNVMNASAVLALNTTYGSAWLRPTTVMQGRLVKFSVQVDL